MSNFKFGNYLELRCQELVRLVHFRMINSFVVAAIAGSSARDFVLKEAQALNIDYAFFDGSIVGTGGAFRHLGFAENLAKAHSEDKLIVLYNIAHLIQNFESVERQIHQILDSSETHGIILCSGYSNDYGARYDALCDSFQVCLKLNRR